MKQLNFRTGLIILGFFIFSTVSHGLEREMVAFYRKGVKSIERDLKKYEVQVKAFEAKDLSAGFIDAVKETKLFYVGKWGISNQIFSNPEYCQAVHEMLKNGGTIFFAYIATPGPGSPGWKFFKKLGVELPTRDPKLQGYSVIPNPKSGSEILNKPYKISEQTGAYGGWRNSGSFEVLLRKTDDPEIAAMLIKKGIAGKGTIILSQAIGIFSKKHGGQTGEELMANILAYSFGSIPEAPGKRVPIKDVYRKKSNIPNVLYLKAADKIYWHFEESSNRIPVIVGETIGMKRFGTPVRIQFQLPGNAVPESLALYTHWGERKAIQVTNCENGTVEAVFEADLEPYQTRLFLIYCGDKKITRAKSPYGFIVAEEENSWQLRNDHLEVVLYKEKPQIGLLKPVGSNTVNDLVTWAGYDFGKANADWTNSKFKAEISENGPVMKQVVYTSSNLKASYTLYRKSKTVFFKLDKIDRKNSKGIIGTYSAWCPMGDGRHDMAVYETSKGIKELDLDCSKYETRQILSFLKEGWLAFADTKGESAGEFFDLSETLSVSLRSHFCHGYSSSIKTKFNDGLIQKGFTAQKGSWDTVRNSYIKWKNPPVVMKGKTISRSEVKNPKVAEFGKEFIRMIGKAHWYNATFRNKDFHKQIDQLFLIVGRLGGNYVKSSEHRLEFNKILIPKAHKRGFGVDLETSCSACPKELEKSLKSVTSAASQGCDMVHFMDEYWFRANCDVCRKAFEDKYKMKMEKWDENKLKEPPQHNYLFFKMKAINEIVKKCSDTIKKNNPNIKCYVTTSPVNYANLYKYHDLETQSDWIMSTSSDVYTTRYNYAKYVIKHMRGAQGNDRPYFSVNGCLRNASDTIKNALMHIMLGANGMWHWVLTDLPMASFTNYANGKVFNWLWLTDSGEIFAKAHPYKYLAVYRDRDAFFDAIKNGDFKAGQQRIQDISSITNVPMNFLYSKYLSLDKLKYYAALIVPSNQVLSDDKAKIIAEYIKGGGQVIIEGKTIQNNIISEVCGVISVGGNMKKAGAMKGTENPLNNLEITSPSMRVPVKIKADNIKVLAKCDSEGVVFERNYGRGKVIYVSLTRMPLEWTKLLTIHMGGKRPLRLSENLEEEIDSNILTDGKRYILAFYNLNGIKNQTGKVKINLSLPDTTMFTNLVNGERKKSWNEYDINLKPNGFSFVLLDTENKYSIPVNQPERQKGSCAYSVSEGMKFLYLKPVAEKAKKSRKKEKGKIYVGVFKSASKSRKGPEIGKYAIMAALKKNRSFNIAPEFIMDADPQTLEFYDVVVFPNMQYRAPNLSKDWEKNVREYVVQGGKVILIHHCAGYASAANAIFPEIGTVSKITPLCEMEAISDHPIVTGKCLRDRFPDKVKDPAFKVYFDTTKMKKGEIFQSGFPDYMEIKPGKEGKTVINGAVQGDKGGTPAVVVGEVGKGRVVLSGMDIGGKVYKKQGKWQMEEKITPGEEAVLINSIFWLTGTH